MLREILPERREARWLLAGVLVSSLGRGLTLPFLFIYLTEVRGFSDAAAGLAVGWFGAVLLICSPIGGTLMDRFGTRRVMLPGYLAQAAGSTVLALVHHPAAILAALAVMAAGGAPTWPGGATLLASLTREPERQRTFGLQFALLNLGIGIGGLIAGAVVDSSRPVTFQIVYLADAVTFLIPFAILLAMRGVGHAPPPRAESGPRGGYLTVLRNRPFRRLLLFALFLSTCGYAQIEVGFAAYAVRVAEVPPRVVAWALAANTVTIVAAQLLVVKRLEGRSRTGALALVGAVFAASWLILGAGGLAGDGSVAAALCVIGCATVFACGETLLQPVMPAVTNLLATDDLRARYNSSITMLMGIASVLGPVTAGPLIGAGLGTLWVVAMVIGCLLASVLALSLRRLLTIAQDGRSGAVLLDPAVEHRGADQHQ
ncbi:putative MFS transporter [Actinoplanes missouriensis 431]|uniref:Putative MFS transporter n=1 Tax=Actinoplanes missouriensis (strain ATCC 14538 / DSM 43046 / CBS 188.64 / JCM 3121 / NBRC 102363 / NCIMB 12654 / NRRL B-3342 / UNCC 431) TaxID=512565 RepID=I0H800_ACTM4|nr:MFS transporter [Actinoplanes missouriensis]BAL89137.1 putative MFS transporter [Actinoplanes missouriensis 431]